MAQDQATASLVKPGRRWIWSVLLSVIIFVCGMAVGSGLTFRFITKTFKKSFQDPSALADQITHRMARRLDLTDEQTIRVREILLENLKAFRALRAEVRPRLIAQARKTRDELKAVLTPEQSHKLERRFHYFLKFWLPREEKELPQTPNSQ